jgi:HNH endonuclease
MTAQIGADGLDLFGDPRPELLADVARVQPEPGDEWVHLGRLGFRSTQRLRLGDLDGGVTVVTWPAELAPQARYLYGGRLGSALVAGAIERGWTVEPSPHLAYHTAPPGRRLYMRPSIAPLDYAARWEDEDALRRVGNHTREDVEHELWPWLKQTGLADDGDDTELRRFLDEFLRRRPAHMRPGLRFRRVWTFAEAAELGSALAETIRSEFDAVFAIAHEPMLGSAEIVRLEAREGGSARAASSHISSFVREAIPERVRHEVWRRDQGRCVDCGSRERLEFDHIIPISRGGSNTARNIELRCEACNRRKSASV